MILPLFFALVSVFRCFMRLVIDSFSTLLESITWIRRKILWRSTRAFQRMLPCSNDRDALVS